MVGGIPGVKGRFGELGSTRSLLVVIALTCVACVGADDAEGPAPDASGGVATEEVGSAAYVPERPECISPADPGGGWDFSCRAAGQALRAAGLLEQQVQVTNMPGGGGGVAFAHVVARRSDDDDLIVAASDATSLRLAQGGYGSFDASSVRWLGALARDVGIVAVPSDSHHRTLDDLIESWRADPASIRFGGGSAASGQDHVKALLLAEAAGIPGEDVTYIPFDGGGEAMTALLGGFMDVFTGDVSETLGRVEADDVRVLAALSDERLPTLPDVPTASELGYDVEWIVWRGFYAPEGMSDEAYDFWVAALRELEASREWQKIREESGLLPLGLFGEEFEGFVDEQVGSFAELSEAIGVGD